MKIGAHFLCEDFPAYIKAIEAIEQSGYDTRLAGRFPDVVGRRLRLRGARVGGDAAHSVRHGRQQYHHAALHRVCKRRCHTRTSTSQRMILGMGRGDSAVRTLGYKQLSTAHMEDHLKKIKVFDEWRGG